MTLHVPHFAVLSGGVGGAKFLHGLLTALDRASDRQSPSSVDVIVNTGDDMWFSGLRVCPDIDSVLYTLCGLNDKQRGWGRSDETYRTSTALHELDDRWAWFALGDLDLATHLARTAWLKDGVSLYETCGRLASRWKLAERWHTRVRVVPMSNAPCETWVRTSRGEEHFEHWWVKHHAEPDALEFVQRGVDTATATPAAVQAIASADVLVLAPSNPIVSVDTILRVPGLLDAVDAFKGPIVGVSPIISGSAVKGMAASCLRTAGVEVSARGVAGFYRDRIGRLDGWLVGEEDADQVPDVMRHGILCRAVPLWMTDQETAATLGDQTLRLWAELR